MAIAQGTSSTWRDISKIEESIIAWKQYLETNYGDEGVEGKPPDVWSLGERKFVCRPDEGLTPSAFPRCIGQNENKIGSQSIGFECSQNSAEELAEQLLGELDKAAAEVCKLVTAFTSSFLFCLHLARTLFTRSDDQNCSDRSQLWNGR